MLNSTKFWFIKKSNLVLLVFWLVLIGSSVFGTEDVKSTDYLKFSGHKTIDIHQTGSSGDLDENSSISSYLRSESLKLDITGHSTGITVDVDINQSSHQDESLSKQKLYLEHENFTITFGEFQSDFVRTNLLEYSDQIDGTTGTFRYGAHKAGFILSTPKGQRKKEIIAGTNSQGPYGLALAPVVAKSETVLVDNIRQEKDVDYKIDYLSGKITFLKGLIETEQEITVTYESSNTDFMDNITGYKYNFSGIPSADTNVYYMQKKTSSEISSTGMQNTDILVISQGLNIVNFSLLGEFGSSKMVPNTLEDTSFEGLAGHLEIGYDDKKLEVKAYTTRLSNNFYSLNSYKINPGDFLYGFDTKYILKKDTNIKAKYDYKDITQNNTPLIEKNTLISGTHKIFNSPTSLKYVNRTYLEDINSTNPSRYKKDNYDLSAKTKLFLGSLTTSTGLETKKYLLDDSNSYEKKIIEAGYSLDSFKLASFAIDGTYKDSYIKSGLTEKEGKLRLSSALKSIKNYSLSGFLEKYKKTSESEKNIIDLKSSFRPIKELSLSFDLNNESLQEIYNEQAVDIEKTESRIKVKLTPIKKVKLNASFRPRIKQIKSSKINVFERKNDSYSLSFPVFKANISYLLKQKHYSKVQTAYYPDFLLADDIKETDTHIARLRVPITNKLRMIVEFEKDFKDTKDLAVTSDAVYDITKEEKEIKKIELVQSFDGLDVGLIYENSLEEFIVPSGNYVLEQKGSLWLKTKVFEVVQVKPQLSVLKTEEDTDDYLSIKPEINIAAPIFNWARLNTNYSILKEYKASNTETTHELDLGIKSELGSNIVFTLNLNVEQHYNPNYQNYEISTKASLIF